MKAFAISLCLIAGLISCNPANENIGHDPKETKAIDSTFTIVESHARAWKVAMYSVKELVDHMPEEHLNYSPDDTIRTFAQQITHIAEASERLALHFLLDQPFPENREQADAASMSKDQLKAYVDSKMGAAEKVISTMTDQQLLNDTVTSFSGAEITKLEALWFIHDHVTNHKAKANLYIRLTGNKPPSYKYN